MPFAPHKGYTLAELRFRPIEQVIDALGCHTLARLLGVSNDTAMRVKRGEWCIEHLSGRAGGQYPNYVFDEREIRRLRDAMEKERA